jgi:hypothetical protein
MNLIIPIRYKNIENNLEKITSFMQKHIKLFYNNIENKNFYKYLKYILYSYDNIKKNYIKLPLDSYDTFSIFRWNTKYTIIKKYLFLHNKELNHFLNQEIQEVLNNGYKNGIINSIIDIDFLKYPELFIFNCYASSNSLSINALSIIRFLIYDFIANNNINISKDKYYLTFYIFNNIRFITNNFPSLNEIKFYRNDLEDKHILYKITMPILDLKFITFNNLNLQLPTNKKYIYYFYSKKKHELKNILNLENQPNFSLIKKCIKFAENYNISYSTRNLIYNNLYFELSQKFNFGENVHYGPRPYKIFNHIFYFVREFNPFPKKMYLDFSVNRNCFLCFIINDIHENQDNKKIDFIYSQIF